METNETMELWRERLRELETGITARELARRYGVADSTVHTWRRKLATKSTTTAVGLVRMGHPMQGTDGGVEIVTPYGFSVRVRRGFDAEVLQQVLRVLAR